MYKFSHRREEILGSIDSLPASRTSPAYLIQPNSGAREGVKLLLGENLNTTSFALGKVFEQDDARRLHIKSDMPGGVGIPQISPRDCYDVLGSVGGNRELKEKVFAINNYFACRVALAMVGEYNCIDMQLLECTEPTLVLSRRDLCIPEIAPELVDGATDPHFGDMVLINLTFEQLLEKVEAQFGRSRISFC